MQNEILPSLLSLFAPGFKVKYMLVTVMIKSDYNPSEKKSSFFDKNRREKYRQARQRSA
jgi:hypothetical protein